MAESAFSQIDCKGTAFFLMDKFFRFFFALILGNKKKQQLFSCYVWRFR